MAAPATVTGATRQRQINDVFLVAPGAFPTIQSAINYVNLFNAGVGQIVVAFSSIDVTPVSALIGGGAAMYITDLRQSQNQNWSWSGTSFVPDDDVQLAGFIAQGDTAARTASTGIGYDPAAGSGNGGGNIVVTANSGKPMPALSIVGQPSDGSAAKTFLLADSSGIALNPGGGAVTVNGSAVRTFANTPSYDATTLADLGAGANLTDATTTPAITLGTITPGGDAATSARAGFCIYVGPDLYNPGLTVGGVIQSFSVWQIAADSTRKIEFYLLAPDGQGGYVPFYKSGQISATGSGAFTYVVPNGIAVRCEPGTVIGVATTSAQANGVPYAGFTSAASSILYGTQSTLALGTTYKAGTAGVSADTHTVPYLQATFQQEGVLVASRHGNRPNAYAKLDASAQVQAAQLSRSLALASDSYTQPPSAISETVGATGTSSGNLGNTFLLTNTPTTLFDGVLRSIQFNATAAGQLIFMLLTPVGDGTYKAIWSSGIVTVAAGAVVYKPDAMAARVPKGSILGLTLAGAQIGGTSGTALYIGVGTTSLPLVVGKTYGLGYDINGVANPANATKFITYPTVPLITMTVTHEAVTVPTKWANLPGGYVQPDVNGNLPVSMYRKADLPWSGKKVSAVGTSITAQNPTLDGSATTTGFINQTFANCAMNGANYGRGASRLCYPAGGDAAHSSLSATIAELTTLGFDLNGSYQNSIIGYAPNLVIFDHGIQDAGAPSGNMFNGDGSLNMDRSTFLGAFNYVIDKIITSLPNCRIVLLTPPTIYYPGTVNPTPTTPDANKNAGIVQRCTDIKTIGNYYGFPVLDMQEELGLHARAVMPAQTDTNNFGTLDGSNPTQYTHNRMARLLTQFVNGV